MTSITTFEELKTLAEQAVTKEKAAGTSSPQSRFRAAVLAINSHPATGKCRIYLSNEGDDDPDFLEGAPNGLLRIMPYEDLVDEYHMLIEFKGTGDEDFINVYMKPAGKNYEICYENGQSI